MLHKELTEPTELYMESGWLPAPGDNELTRQIKGLYRAEIQGKHMVLNQVGRGRVEELIRERAFKKYGYEYSEETLRGFEWNSLCRLARKFGVDFAKVYIYGIEYLEREEE